MTKSTVLLPLLVVMMAPIGPARAELVGYWPFSIVISGGPREFKVAPPPGGLSGSNAWGNLLHLSAAAAKQRRAGIDAQTEHSGLKLGHWYCAGPFKDTAEGLHLRSFATVFPPERQVLAAGANPIDLAVAWQVERYPGMTGATRRWVKHPEWIDGYLNQLPVGPPPMKNETCYLYRTLAANSAAAVEMHVLARDDVRVWLNGRPVGEAHNPARSGASRFAAHLATNVQLQPGENRLLLKITSMHGVHGFSFALPPFVPSNPVRPGGASWNPLRFYPGNEPYFCRSQADAAASQRRYRQECLKEDGIPTAGPPGLQHGDFSRAILRRLSLPAAAAALLPKAGEAGDLARIRELYFRCCRFSDALEKVRRFRFEIEPLPMYDPARLKMVEVLEATAPPSAGGRAYLARLAAVKEVAAKALADWEAGNLECEGEMLEAAGAIDAMWSDQIGSLPPIAFIRCPPFHVNAISPYIARGAAPAAICVLDPAKPQQPPKVIYEDPAGAIFDMNLSYDAATIFFSARRRGIEGGWHIYEIGSGGDNLRQITRGNSDNISPLLLPGGEIMFVSTRSGNHVVCQQGASGVLYVCNRDGTRVRRVSGNTLSDHTPQIMNDGRVLFTRWDYGVDKNVFARQTPWTVNPDGTRLQLFFGNTIEDPNSFWQMRAIPNRPEVVCVFGPHHNYHAGMIGVIWNRLGFEAPRGEGFRWITSEMSSIGDTTLPWGYRDPYPINERLFLVSYGGDGARKNRLYLLDDRGNRKCLYESSGNLGCWNPLPLRPRKRPPVIPPVGNTPEFVSRNPAEANRNPDDGLTGTFFLQDVYEGLSPGVRRGEIKALQIVEQVPRVGTIQGKALFGHWSVIGRGTMYVRRLVGTVPVESDGSAHFTAPALRDISLNALDAQGRAIRRMGSTTQIMPGETIGCVGCHERRDSTPVRPAAGVPKAALRGPSTPQYPPWTDKGILDFNRVVQPVLDKYCVECHSGPKPDGLLDLSSDKTHFFSMAYDQLLDHGLVHYIPVAGTDHAESTPKSRGSLVSRIRRHIETDRCCRPLPPEDRRRIYAWIDANVPYYGTYDVTDRRVIGGRDRWFVDDRDGWFHKEFLPVFNRRCMSCHQRYLAPQTYNYNPGGNGTILVTSSRWNDTALSQFQLGHGRICWTGQIGPDGRINLTHPDWSRMLTAPLPTEAGGLGLCRPKEDLPKPFSGTSDPDYLAMRRALRKAHETLMAHPRVDMPPKLGEN